ncbi:zonadhesin-like [Huso huso]|uniref:Zonadhesin-like n=1 Tax=Huso huso TaxID=61971 RepID=A0ABR0YZN4_HUSHU
MRVGLFAVLWVYLQCCVWRVSDPLLCVSLVAVACPPNSHYQTCVSPCPPSCLPPAPQACQRPCAEGCQCDPGFVQSAGGCVREESCGCSYNGSYYQPGDEFFGPECLSRCLCELNNVTSCRPWSCSDQEHCGVESGELGCHPTGSASCVISGDPHYMSFDGRLLSFMGTCTYTHCLTPPSLPGPWFSVEGKNEERGVQGASYLRKLYITVGGASITLMKSQRTLVNGVRVRLPHSPLPSVSISMTGQYVAVRTTFGLSVRWDGNHYADITVPRCGNYDGDGTNDFMTPGGGQAGSSDEFGNSWQTEQDEDKECHPDNETDPPCDPKLQATVSSPENCGRINDTQGPFRDCISVVDPHPYLQSCVYDMCRYEGLQQALCDQLQAFTAACLSAGAPVHNWRGPSFCPLSCPPDSHYSLCASVCPQSCPGTAPPAGCSEEGCVEGCECDPGFLLSDGRCVPLSNCGCVDKEGSYHPTDESWFLPGCFQRCSCLGQNRIECEETSCTGAEVCELQEGEYGCHALDRETCSVSGDPHYASFDRALHHFQGSCSYTLSQPCNASSGSPDFSVVTENERRGNNQRVSYVRAVHVSVGQRHITLAKGRRVTVDGVRVTPPLRLPEGVTVRLGGTFVSVETDFGLWVRFDGNHHADVSVPSSYRGLLCGLCGNYNGDPRDDNLKPDGQPAGGSAELGESWQVPDNRTECSHDGGVDMCDPKVESEAKKPTSCGMITDPKGEQHSGSVFQPCHSAVAPDVFLESCMYDACATGGGAVELCQALQSYASLCAQAGIIISWRNKTFCPLSCPAGSHYTPCGSACPSSCVDPGAPNACPLPCGEGCQCDPGLVQSGDRCVPFSQCGCQDQNNYHPVGDSWFPALDCSRRCTCSTPNTITCQDWQCSPAETCQNLEGELACHSTGGAVCHVAGDPHYYTFDRVMHTFMGTCTYTLVEVCNASLVTPLTITAKNEERGQPLASYVRSVSVAIHGTTVTLSKSRRILVDGRRVLPPLSGSIPGVSLFTSGVYAVLQTDFGVSVRFDGVHHVEIFLPGSYYHKVSAGPRCERCG